MVGLLAMAILFLHHFPQYEADRKHGKKTPIVRLGPQAAGRWVPWILAAPYVLVLVGVATRLFPETTLVLLPHAALEHPGRAHRARRARPSRGR